jgi:NO-binding membrane sensor protein with MHYT domain
MLSELNFSYGVLTPVLGFVMSCLGAFLALRCTSRAREYSGAVKARWLVAAAVSLGTTGIWVMHFIAMLGYTIPGMTITYDVPETIGSMVLAVAVVCAGLLFVGFGQQRARNLVLAGVITGLGVAAMHYTGMMAMRMPARMAFSPGLLVLSVVIAIVAATAALWAALRLGGVLSTLGAALIMGVAVSGMHYTGMAAMHVYRISTGTGMAMSGTGATALTFLLPLVVGISVTSFVLTTAIAISPDQHEIRAEVDLRARISRGREPEETFAAPAAAPPPPTRPAAPAPTGRPGSRAGQALQGRRQAASGARRDDPRPR